MRYLILSDIHSNLEALERSLELARGKYETVVCLGDIVGYGPDPRAAIDVVKQTAHALIRGNHDKACCGITDAEDFNPVARAAVLWTRKAITSEHCFFLRQLAAGPLSVADFEVVHGSEQDEDEYILGSAEAIPALKSQTAPLVFFGHTHCQGGFSLSDSGAFQPFQGYAGQDGAVSLEPGRRYLINPGSVGQPRDHDWRAAFAIYDDQARHVEFYRTAYDLPTTQKKMQQAALPEPLIHRLEIGR
ncbi:MAG: metallophosphoesterase family protein [Terriglobia bacterium]